MEKSILEKYRNEFNNLDEVLEKIEKAVERLHLAVFKFNGGVGALLCSKCSCILKSGSQMTEEERSAMRGEIKIEAQYCNKCNQEIKLKLIKQRLK
jgi:hypothetical protein